MSHKFSLMHPLSLTLEWKIPLPSIWLHVWVEKCCWFIIQLSATHKTETKSGQRDWESWAFNSHLDFIHCDSFSLAQAAGKVFSLLCCTLRSTEGIWSTSAWLWPCEGSCKEHMECILASQELNENTKRNRIEAAEKVWPLIGLWHACFFYQVLKEILFLWIDKKRSPLLLLFF